MKQAQCILFLVAAAAAAMLFAERVTAQTAPQRGAPPTSPLITGPAKPIHEALAGGAAATITLQPVPPKTVPASTYPPGSSIFGQTLLLGSVPARIWIEIHVTGWAPELLKSMQLVVDATDVDGDGGGFLGGDVNCAGEAATGAGDLAPAAVPCDKGRCQNNPSVSCWDNDDCGNTPCIVMHSSCRAALSGMTAACELREPSRCVPSEQVPYLPPRTGGYCEWAFVDKCDAEFILSGIEGTAGVLYDTQNALFGSHAHAVPALDFGPSYAGTLVLDVPANAKGSYTIDVREEWTFLQDYGVPPENNIPVLVEVAWIQVAYCEADGNCDDNDECTVESCIDACCTKTPVAGWNPATECCHPMTGVQANKPDTTDCAVGGCSLVGSSGVPMQFPQPKGTPCDAGDPCRLPGQCNVTGECAAEGYAGPDCPKARFISIEPDTGTTPAAYRVRLMSLHHPDPPYNLGTAADFSAYEGEVRWVGPPGEYPESSAELEAFYASFLTCQPHYRDWSSISLLHITGPEIVPSSIYEVQSLAGGLDPLNEANYSTPIEIATTRWGEAIIPYNPPATTEQPDAGDLAALVKKFRNLPDPIPKSMALLAGEDTAGTLNLINDVSFAHVAATLDAFRGLPYPYSGPAPCP